MRLRRGGKNGGDCGDTFRAYYVEPQKEKADIIITKYMDRLKDTPYEHTGFLDKYYADSHEFVDGVNRKLGAAGGIFTLCASCVLAA